MFSCLRAKAVEEETELSENEGEGDGASAKISIEKRATSADEINSSASPVLIPSLFFI